MPEQVLEVPYVLIATVEQLCEEVLACRERSGIILLLINLLTERS
jgi:hypothetical protein